MSRDEPSRQQESEGPHSGFFQHNHITLVCIMLTWKACYLGKVKYNFSIVPFVRFGSRSPTWVNYVWDVYATVACNISFSTNMYCVCSWGSGSSCCVLSHGPAQCIFRVLV